ncbi:MAG: hypothetical protein ACI97A_002026 [Planctomycetota bacterium]|jgi:hypothetical protein
MTDDDTSQSESTEDDLPIIHVDIRLTRRIGVLPPLAMSMWQGFKAFLSLASLLGMFLIVLKPEVGVGEGLRYAMCLIVLWQFWEHIVARTQYGVSHILVTTKGVCFTDENIYVRWNDIENWKNDGKLLRMRPKDGHGPRGFMAPKECDIPLTEMNREFLLEIFRERVPRWRPDSN